MKPLLQAMKERRLYLDGGMGRMLQAAGLPEGLLPDVWGMENPQAVQGVHRAYLEAGCRLITTNTFGTSAPKLAPYGVTPAQVMTAAVANVRAAMDQAGVTDGYVCADIGPSGSCCGPMGTWTLRRRWGCLPRPSGPRPRPARTAFSLRP